MSVLITTLQIFSGQRYAVVCLNLWASHFIMIEHAEQRICIKFWQNYSETIVGRRVKSNNPRKCARIRTTSRQCSVFPFLSTTMNTLQKVRREQGIILGNDYVTQWEGQSELWESGDWYDNTLAHSSQLVQQFLVKHGII